MTEKEMATSEATENGQNNSDKQFKYNTFSLDKQALFDVRIVYKKCLAKILAFLYFKLKISLQLPIFLRGV